MCNLDSGADIVLIVSDCRPSRSYLLKTLFNIFVSPFSAVGFKDFFIADQLISLVRVLIDLFYSFCFYSTGDFITNNSAPCAAATSTSRWLLAPLPSWWRLMQVRFGHCLPLILLTSD